MMFLPVAENTRRRRSARSTQDDLGVSYYKDDTIDLGEVVREQFYLALPMKPLCREECRGLCPVCGMNQNREDLHVSDRMGRPAVGTAEETAELSSKRRN